MKRVSVWWPIILLALLPLVPLGRAVLTSDSVGAFDQIRQMAPWNGPKPQQAWDVLQADSVLQFYVWRKLTIEDGLTTTNPYQLGGAPLAANSQSAVWYPFHLAARTVGLSAGTAIDLLAWLHLALAGLGVYALARKFEAGRTAAALAGVSFQLSPFLLGWTALASVPTTVAWIPWVGWGALHVGPRWKTWIPLPLILAMLLTAGHLQFAAYGLAIALVCGIYRVFSAKDFRGFVALGIATGIAVGVALALPHLMPVFANSQNSHRRNVASEEGYQAYVGSAIQGHEVLARLVGPFAHGNPLNQDENWPTEYLPSLTRPGANFAESAVTVGPLVLIGAFLALLRRRSLGAVGLWGGVALVSLLVAMGTPINRLLYFGVPGWSSTGSPGRVAVLFVMALCVLGAIGLTRLGKEEDKAVAPWAIAIGAATLLALAGIFAGSEPYPAGLGDSDPAEIVWMEVWTDNAMLVGLWGVVSVVVLVLVREMPRYAIGLTALAALFSTSTGVVSLVRSGDPSFLREPIEGLDSQGLVAIVNDNWTFVGAPRALFPPNTCAVAGIRELGGYDSLMHRDTKAKLDRVNLQDSSPAANGNIAFVKPTADPGRLLEAGVTQVWTLKPMPQIEASDRFLPAREHPRGFLVYALVGPARIRSITD